MNCSEDEDDDEDEYEEVRILFSSIICLNSCFLFCFFILLFFCFNSLNCMNDQREKEKTGERPAQNETK